MRERTGQQAATRGPRAFIAGLFGLTLMGLLGAPALAQSPATPAIVAAQPPSIFIEVRFKANSAQLLPGAKADLTALANALKDPSLATNRFAIAAHTNAKRPKARNQTLSTRRARTVRDMLIAEHGLDPSRLVASDGESRTADNSGPRGRRSRSIERIEVINVGPAR